MIVHQLRHGRIHVGDWREADLKPGYSLAIVDGPYAMGIAAWDKMRLDDLADWYAPHIERLTSLMTPSASVYLWNTAAGWARIDPVMRAAGWTFRALVTWDKGIGAMAGKIDTAAMRTWFDVTEVAGFYQRQPDITGLLRREREQRGVSSRDLAMAVVGSPSGAVWNWENGSCHPTEDNWVAMWRALNALGPHWVLPGCPKWSLQVLQTAQQATEQEIRAEYRMLRPAFTLPPGITNVWTAPLVSGAERLKGPDGAALHPCQKPVLFAERMIRASTRPAERVLVPFGGTCREAVACEWMARVEPDEARSYDVCELNQDGRDYIGPVLAQIQGEDARQRAPKQVGLFSLGAK